MTTIRFTCQLTDGRHARLELLKLGWGFASLALVAHKSQRVANDWLQDKKRGKAADGVTTGTGLAVFSWALKACVDNLCWIKSNGIKYICICMDCDDRRLSAYKKLMKRYNVDWHWMEWEGDEYIVITL
jgi:hypothetical protein